MVLDNENNLFVGSCDIDQEDLQQGAISEIKPVHAQLEFDGEMYKDDSGFNQKYLIDGEGRLHIFDNYGLIDTYPSVFLDTEVFQ